MGRTLRERLASFDAMRLRVGLVVTALILLSTPVMLSSTVVRAADVTSGLCTSTVDNAVGVTMTVATNGDCVLTFATAPTAGSTIDNSVLSKWTVPAGITSVKLLIVAGGGGGGSNDVNSAAGGGGGGVVVLSGYSVTPGELVSIFTGAGGKGKTGCSPTNGNAYKGSDSKFGALIAKGGGGGSGCSASTQSGGSGGGQVLVGVAATTQATLGTKSNSLNIIAYGNPGGTGNNSENASGGGGGAVGAGVGPSSTSVAGKGGEGIANQFRTESSIVYGSGGGGAGTTPGAGGTNAGKGNGDATAGGGVGKHGVDETGSGGGGVGRNVASGEGGSGVVVVRYSSASAPVATALPALSGNPYVGTTLSATAGSWAGTPDVFSYTYQWMRQSSIGQDFTNIDGAVSSTYEIVTADLGYRIKLVVTSSNGVSPDASTESVTTAAVTEVPPVNTAVPVITGTFQKEQTLSVSDGSWDKSPTSYIYQWLRSSTVGGTYVAISGATASTYVVAAGDVGNFIKASVVAALSSANSLSAFSVATTQVIDAIAVNTVLPAVNGTARMSQTLSISAGSWSNSITSYRYQWMSSQTAGGTYAAISGATASTYVVVAGDVGNFIKASVAVVNTGGTSAYSLSPATAQVVDIAPVVSAVPVVSGTAQTGQTLTVSNGSWANRPTSYKYRWMRSTTVSGTYAQIVGAEASTYVVVAGDVGYFIKGSVAGVNTGGTSAYSLSVATAQVVDIAPVVSVVPVVSGISRTGQTLTVSNGTWSNRATSHAYQWMRSAAVDGTYEVIGGATGSTYVVVAGDVGYFIKGSVAGVNTGGTSAYSLSVATAQVIDIAPEYSGPPSISGIAQTGQTLTVSNGSWANRPTSYVYQWMRSATFGGTYVAISNATTSTYVVTVEDLGYFIKATVIGSNSGGTAAASAWSGATAASIDIAPANSTQPIVTGTTQTGKTLTASNGVWSNRPTSYGYQWSRSLTVNGTYAVIAGAESATYVISADDVGYFIRGVVTANNTGGSVVAVSIATLQVIDVKPVMSVAPAVLGITQTGKTLTVSNGLWDNRPTSYSYQWKRSTSSTGPYLSIADATSATYIISGEDVGYYFKATVTAINSGGNADEVAWSIATAISIDIAPVNSVAPSIMGTAQNGQTLTAVNGTWANRPTLITYQWARSLTNSGFVDIDGANSNTYELDEGDVGYRFKLGVVASNTGGVSALVLSSSTIAVLDIAPVIVSNPSVNGTGQVGQRLTAATGSWRSSPTSYAYQWKRSSSANGSFISIGSETSSTYDITVDDVGQYIKVAVIATNDVGSSAASLSAARGSIIDIIAINVSAPIVTGILRNGEELSASIGQWNSSPSSYAYQWKRSPTATGVFTNVSGATNAIFALTDDDIDQFIKVAVVAVNSGGSSVAELSVAVGQIEDLPTVPAPTVSQLSIKSLAGGFTFQVSNYSSTYTYALTVSAGSATMNDTGLIAVKELDAGSSASVTVRASRVRYRSASLVVQGEAIAAPSRNTNEEPTPVIPSNAGAIVTPTTTTTTTTIAAKLASSGPSTPQDGTASKNTPSTTIAVVSGVKQGQTQSGGAGNPEQSTMTTQPKGTSTTVPAPVVQQAQPGAGVATINGQVVASVVTRVDNQVVVTSGGLSAAVGVLNPDGSVASLDEKGNVRVKPGQLFSTELGGFVAGTKVEVWMYSTPHLLGSMITDANGKVRATFELPSGLESGDHRLAFVGTGPDGKESTIVIGVVAGAAPKKVSSMKILIAIPILLAILIGLMLPGVLRRRRIEG